MRRERGVSLRPPDKGTGSVVDDGHRYRWPVNRADQRSAASPSEPDFLAVPRDWRNLKQGAAERRCRHSRSCCLVVRSEPQ